MGSMTQTGRERGGKMVLKQTEYRSKGCWER